MCCTCTADPSYHFKMLVPSMVAGAIIGKGGETIAQLQKETGARIKMSKSHDFYPGNIHLIILLVFLLTHLDSLALTFLHICA